MYPKVGKILQSNSISVWGSNLDVGLVLDFAGKSLADKCMDDFYFFFVFLDVSHLDYPTFKVSMFF